MKEMNEVISKKDNGVLIAEFMGYKEHNHGSYKTYKRDDEPHGSLMDTGDLRFSTDWNALMKVVEKIEQTTLKTEYWDILSCSVYIANNYCRIEFHERQRQPCIVFQTPYGASPESKIQAVYDGVVEFVNWYNQSITPSTKNND